MNHGGNEGLVAFQARLEEEAAAVKATTTATENKNKFMIPDEIREVAAAAAKCRDPVRRCCENTPAKLAERSMPAGEPFPGVRSCRGPW